MPRSSPPETSTREHRVCARDELPPGGMRLLPLGKFGVGVFNVHGQFFAITNYCPHEGGPLCLGRVQGTTVVDQEAVGGTGYVLDGQVIRCPWHQWEFDLASGRTISEPLRRIRAYPVRVVNGDVMVTV